MAMDTDQTGNNRQVVFLIDGSGGKGPIQSLLQNYCLPLIFHFHTLDANQRTTEYGAVVFRDYLNTRAILDILPFTSEPRILIDWINNIRYEGGGFGVALAEGLAVALQMLTEKGSFADAGGQNIILFCNGIPYSTQVMLSDSYAGKNLIELASECERFNINLSVICPRRLDELVEVFEEAGKHIDAVQHNTPLLPHELVLFRGFQPPNFTQKLTTTNIDTLMALSTDANIIWAGSFIINDSLDVIITGMKSPINGTWPESIRMGGLTTAPENTRDILWANDGSCLMSPKANCEGPFQAMVDRLQQSLQAIFIDVGDHGTRLVAYAHTNEHGKNEFRIYSTSGMANHSPWSVFD